jgi:hypothetical protein
LTVNSESAAKHAGISLRDLEGLREEGVKFLTYNKLSGIHPDWYQTSFNDRRFTEDLFRERFCEVRYVTTIFGWQDAVVARKVSSAL